MYIACLQCGLFSQIIMYFEGVGDGEALLVNSNYKWVPRSLSELIPTCAVYWDFGVTERSAQTGLEHGCNRQIRFLISVYSCMK